MLGSGHTEGSQEGVVGRRRVRLGEARAGKRFILMTGGRRWKRTMPGRIIRARMASRRGVSGVEDEGEGTRPRLILDCCLIGTGAHQTGV